MDLVKLGPDNIYFIASYLTAQDCRNLALVSKEYLWLLDEKSLWRQYCSLELEMTRRDFDKYVSGLTPIEVYLSSIQCMASDKGQDCRRRRQLFSVYCQKHKKEVEENHRKMWKRMRKQKK